MTTQKVNQHFTRLMLIEIQLQPLRNLYAEAIKVSPERRYDETLESAETFFNGLEHILKNLVVDAKKMEAR